LKILSINLWNINSPIQKRMNNLNSFITFNKPDIICFQEVSYYGGKIQVHDILCKGEYFFKYFKSGNWYGREEGLIIASKYPISNSRKYLLPRNDAFNDFQRILMGSTIRIKKNKLRVYNTHLSYHVLSAINRIGQIDQILKIINSENSRSDSVILCGDFNEDPDDGLVYKNILNNYPIKLNDSWVERNKTLTFCQSNPYVDSKLWPNRRIDYIFSSENLPLYSYRVLDQDIISDICSDHYGVIAEGNENGDLDEHI